MSWEDQGRQTRGWFGHGKAPEHENEDTRRQNVADMTQVIYNEARGEGRLAMIAVGHTIHNRMLRNRLARVDEVWRGYNHRSVSGEPQSSPEFRMARDVATGILNGSVADPTDGATHYYSPKSAPKKVKVSGTRMSVADWRMFPASIAKDRSSMRAIIVRSGA